MSLFLENSTSAQDPFATDQDDAKPHFIDPGDLTPKNWKSNDGMYPDRRGGFNSQDRTLWRKDRYNAVYGRYRDKNGEYRDKNGHKLGEDNVTLLSFNNDKPFPGWANKPGSQFHPDDHPKVDADFYRNRESWPAKGLRSLALHPFEDDWNENGVPLKNEFHDLTTLPAFKGLDSKQLPDRVAMDKVFELQQQAIQDQAHAARQQTNQTANPIQQIGNIVQAAAPLVAQGVSALAGVVSGGGGSAGDGSVETNGTSAGLGSTCTGGTVGGNSNNSTGSVKGGLQSMPIEAPSVHARADFHAQSGGTDVPVRGAGTASQDGFVTSAEDLTNMSPPGGAVSLPSGEGGNGGVIELGEGKGTIHYDPALNSLKIIDENGVLVGELTAVSGTKSLKRLASGEYVLDGPVYPVGKAHEHYSSFQDLDGNAWWQRLKPLFPTERTGLGIHPDGNVPGTAGCIGIKGDNTLDLRDVLREIGSGGKVAVERR